MGLFTNLIQATVGVVTLPIDIVQDVAETASDVWNCEEKHPESHTAKKLSKITDKIDDALDSDELLWTLNNKKAPRLGC